MIVMTSLCIVVRGRVAVVLRVCPNQSMIGYSPQTTTCALRPGLRLALNCVNVSAFTKRLGYAKTVAHNAHHFSVTETP